jgi:hypothetical protein
VGHDRVGERAGSSIEATDIIISGGIFLLSLT